MKKAFIFGYILLFLSVVLAGCATSRSVTARKAYSSNRFQLNQTPVTGSPALVLSLILQEVGKDVLYLTPATATDVLLIYDRRPGSFLGTNKGVGIIAMHRESLAWYYVDFLKNESGSIVAVERISNEVISITVEKESSQTTRSYRWYEATGDNDKQARWERVPDPASTGAAF